MTQLKTLKETSELLYTYHRQDNTKNLEGPIMNEVEEIHRLSGNLLEEDVSITHAIAQFTRVYEREVNSIAQDIIGQAKEEKLTADAVNDRLWEFVDNHHWIIYTRYNLMILMVSRNDEACLDEMGEMPRENWKAAMAFFAMLADVREEMDRIGFDWNNPQGDEEGEE